MAQELGTCSRRCNCIPAERNGTDCARMEEQEKQNGTASRRPRTEFEESSGKFSWTTDPSAATRVLGTLMSNL